MDVLAGRRSASGRLPITQYPAEYVEGLAESEMALRPSGSYPGRTYKWYTGTPTYPFGFGLHYTTFAATIAPPSTYSIPPSSSSSSSTYAEHTSVADVQITLTNTGATVSDYAALLFARHTNGPAPHPRRSLVGYSKLKALQPGESRTAKVRITQAALARADERGNQILYPGEYTLELDTESEREQVLATAKLVLTGAEANVVPWPKGDMS